MTISVHEGYKRSYSDLFSAVEVIFRSYEGRPRWGKVHTHKAADFEGLYPDWEKFKSIRKEFDPHKCF